MLKIKLLPNLCFFILCALMVLFCLVKDVSSHLNFSPHKHFLLGAHRQALCEEKRFVLCWEGSVCSHRVS